MKVVFIASLIFEMSVSTAQGASLQVNSSVKKFTSGGEAIQVECFVPEVKGQYPALLLLHGIDGLVKRHRDYQKAAQQISSKGFVVLLVHYFDRTRTKIADKATMEKHFLDWVKVVHDGILFARQMTTVDSSRIGLIGYSMGGYLSMSAAVLAFQDKVKPKAIVELFGGLPKLLAWNIGKIPPTLILHGEKDRIVSVREAHTLAELLTKAKVPYEMKIYKNQGHGFSGNEADDAIDRSVTFLNKYLRGNQK